MRFGDERGYKEAENASNHVAKPQPPIRKDKKKHKMGTHFTKFVAHRGTCVLT